MGLEDIDIIKKIKSGDKDLFVDLYDKYFDKIYNFIFYKVGNKQDVQDICSDTFLKAFDAIGSFNTKSRFKFSSWLYKIANNNVIDYYRANFREISLEPVIDYLTQQKNILDDIENSSTIDNVLEYLESLDNTKKNIFIMRIWDGLSYEEISQIIGKSVNNCKVIFHRTLKDIVNKYGISAVILFII